jgi:hypothetical protein
LDDGFVRGVGEGEEGVGEGAGGVDYALFGVLVLVRVDGWVGEGYLGTDVPLVAGEAVFETCAIELAGFVLVELGYFAVVGGYGAVLDCAQN